MDEEFFFPQNVQTTYRLFGMGPKHLRRLLTGSPVILVAMVLASRWMPVPWVVTLAAILLVGYAAGYCWPTNGENALFDLWLNVRRLRRSQTIFIRQEVLPAAEPECPDDALAESH
jgi:hypothetical protein